MAADPPAKPAIQLNHIEVEWRYWKVRINYGSRGLDYEFKPRRGSYTADWRDRMPADIVEQFDEALAEINLGEYLGNLIGGDGKI